MATGAKPTRRQRRAADGSLLPGTVTEIPLAQPDRSGPKDRTLIDLAREREAELYEQMPKQSSSGASDEAADAVLSALLYGFTLTSLNFTLDVLVWQQYAQEMSYSYLIKRNLTTSLPLFVFVVFLFHSPWFGIVRFERLRQALFFCIALAAGMYAVLLNNDKAYLAVMKKAPPTGTIWVWAVLEMGAAGGAGSLLLVGAWTWWNGYTVT